MTDDESPTVDPDDESATADHDEHEAILRQITDDHGFLRELGLTIEAVEEGEVRVRVPYHEEYTNLFGDGVMHGGIAASALDTVMGFAVSTRTYHDPGKRVGPTVSLTVDYVSTATEPLVATGEIVRVGSTTAIVEGRVEGAESGNVIATAQGVWRVFDADRD